jgi:protoheme IX farnesyltransferase
VVAEKSWLAVMSDLVKARLTSLVLLTTLMGFYLGSSGPMEYGLLWAALAGTGLLACGASALNQYLERDLDAKMRRTQDRPLPSGRMTPPTVLALGWVWSVAGVLLLTLGVNLLTGLVGALTLATYVWVYTPLKRVTWLNTLVGAVPGGLPPLMGWTAATGTLGAGGWALFAIQFFWQVPHFMAIAWLYREEYARAGFQMLPVLDPQGRRTSRLALGYALGLVLASFGPALLGLAGPAYLAGAAALGAAFLWPAGRFARRLEMGDARWLFYGSITYLPLLLSLLVINKNCH